MDDYDRNNLNFLLKTDNKELEKWYNGISDQEKEYASTLLKRYSEELSIKQHFQNTEHIEINAMPDAETYLRRFRLK